ncbi:hypothetical protein FO519_004671 [Halicephalobus sp. NKZ332]|nr:hypothetical protein FO519_004671 [Halicephalobus sp. NKZ332]
MRKGKLHKIWNYFVVKDGDAVCNIDNCQHISKKGYSTNMISHLRNKHHDTCLQYQNNQIGDKRLYEKARESGELLNMKKLIARLFLTSSITKDIYQNQWYQKSHNGSLPSYTAVKEEMYKMSAEIRSRISQELKDVRVIYVCLDIWTKKNCSSSYITFNAHYLLDDNKKIATLGVSKISQHDNNSILTKLKEILTLFNIDYEKLGFVVTDNATPMRKAFKYSIPSGSVLISPVEIADEELNPVLSAYWLGCTAHSLQFILK